jgi:protein-tyrosine phosphatase
MTRILFVCMGNICRSPTVETIARVEFARVGFDAQVASAGTENYHIGEPADPRSIAMAERHGYPLLQHRARQLARADFARFDFVLAMDRRNLDDLQRFRPAQGGVAPALFLGQDEVPDPYYGGDADFERVIALARSGVDALVQRLRATAVRRA